MSASACSRSMPGIEVVGATSSEDFLVNSSFVCQLNNNNAAAAAAAVLQGSSSQYSLLQCFQQVALSW